MTTAATTVRTGGRPRTRRAVRTAADGLASALLGLLTWQALLLAGVLPARFFPDALELVAAFGWLLGLTAFWSVVAHTLGGAMAGLLLAAALAVPLGILIGRSAPLFHATRFVLEFLRPIPTVALIPLAVLMLGTGNESKLLLVGIASFFPVLVQSVYGARDVEPLALVTARLYGFSPARRLLLVVLPAAAPYIATGVRISGSVALLVAVSTELIIGAPGLGQAITTAESGFALDQMYALIATTGLLGVAVNGVLVAAEARVAGWRRTGAGGGRR